MVVSSLMGYFCSKFIPFFTMHTKESIMSSSTWSKIVIKLDSMYSIMVVTFLWRCENLSNLLIDDDGIDLYSFADTFPVKDYDTFNMNLKLSFSFYLTRICGISNIQQKISCFDVVGGRNFFNKETASIPFYILEIELVWWTQLSNICYLLWI